MRLVLVLNMLIKTLLLLLYYTPYAFLTHGMIPHKFFKRCMHMFHFNFYVHMCFFSIQKCSISCLKKCFISYVYLISDTLKINHYLLRKTGNASQNVEMLKIVAKRVALNKKKIISRKFLLRLLSHMSSASLIFAQVLGRLALPLSEERHPKISWDF